MQQIKQYHKLLLYFTACLIVIAVFSQSFAAKESKKWNVIRSYQVDLTGDKRLERIVVSSTAPVDKQGKILYDDSQWWKLSIWEHGKERVVFEEFIVLGSIHVVIGMEKNNPVILLIRDTGDDLKVFKYCYDPKSNAYLNQCLVAIDKTAYSVIAPYAEQEKN